jgi:hypothetical protein
MRSPDALEEAIDFITAEVVRYARMSIAEVMAARSDMAFDNIIDWQGQRRPISRKAAEVMVELAEEALAASTYHRRIARDRAIKSVFKMIGEIYINPDRREKDGIEIGGDLNDAIENAGRACAAQTHYIPCAVHIPKGEQVPFGPVTIRPMSEVLDSLSAEVDAYTGQDQDKLKHAGLVVDYYKAFPDVAVVTVPDCDQPTSKSVADHAVQSALDVMHVLAGAGYSGKMRAGGPALNRDRRGQIIQAEDGLIFSLSSHASRGAYLGDSWWTELRERRGDISTWIGEPISALVQARDPELIGGRFLDSASWYGDAARDRSPAAAIVKYLTSLEVLMWAGDDNRWITKRIAGRAAAFCCSADGSDFDDIEKKVRTAYGVRSDLVHGRVSPNDPRVSKSAYLCDRVAHDVLRAWLFRFGPGFGQPSSMDRLKTWFDALVKQARHGAGQFANGGRLAAELAPTEP